MSGEARYATRRNEANPTYGARVAHIAATVMGTPLMPWQRQVADVALELDPNNPGAWRYPTVVVSVPRQSGKTALMRAVAVDRMLSYRSHLIQMTAQTGKDARKRWDQIVEALRVDKHPKRFKKLASKGSESLEYLRSGSKIQPFAPTPTAVHGDSLNLVMIDEAWAFDEVSGTALTAAVAPTFLTVIDSQLWIVSTKGTAKSAYLNSLIERGRAAVDDPDSALAYFEWSADPEETARDPYSRESLSFHPAIGHTQTYEKILTVGKDEARSTWLRSYLNLTDSTGIQSIVDLAVWDSLSADIDMPDDPGDVTLAFDVAEDRSAATIYGAYKTADGVHMRLVATDNGSSWLANMLARLHDAGYTRIVADSVGPTRTVVDDLKSGGIEVETLTSREYASACQWLIDKTTAGEISHDTNHHVSTGLETVELTTIGGTKAFSPTRTATPIDALRALTIAGWSAATQQTGLQLFIQG